MPRLDLTDIYVQQWFKFVFNEGDPGATNKGRPIDLCRDCFDLLDFHGENGSPERPEYDSEEYFCWECDIRLNDEED